MPDQDKQTAILTRKITRERLARKEAERLLELKSLELFEANQTLKRSNQNLDQIVAERTQALKLTQERAETTALDLRDSLKRIELVIQAANTVIWDWNVKENVFRCSNRIETELGYFEDELCCYEDFMQLVLKGERHIVEQAFSRHMGSGEGLDVNCRLKHKNGKYRWFHVIGQNEKDDSGNSIRIVGSINDIHDRIENQKTFQKMAHNDALTNIHNRSFFNQHAKELFEKGAKHPETKFALLIIDLNDFKTINDRYGHVAGDRMLCHVANTLTLQTKGYDVVARLGGDEFAIILNNLSPQTKLDTFCEKLITSAGTPLEISGHSLSASLSIGISRFPEDGDHMEKLLRCADVAMYSAKRTKVAGSSYVQYHPDMDKNNSRRRTLRDDIERALLQSEFRLSFQPCFDIRQNTFRSGEALLRWPSRIEKISIQEVISVAEESGLILQLGEWVIDSACQFIATLESKGLDHKIAINLSPIQFQYQEIEKVIKCSIERHKINPKHLQVEVTENLFLDNMERAVRILESLHDLGLEIYIDDFGTGYSSLKYLQELPVDWVKVDKTFIDGLGKKQNSMQIVKAVIDMTHSMNRGVVAEGVETAEQFELLLEIGCDIIQGYYISKPLFSEDYISYLEEHTAPVQKLANR